MNVNVVMLCYLNTRVGNGIVEGVVMHDVSGRNEYWERIRWLCVEQETVTGKYIVWE